MAVKSLESALDTSGLADEQRDLIDLIAKCKSAAFISWANRDCPLPNVIQLPLTFIRSTIRTT